jgi:hypothetical protein
MVMRNLRTVLLAGVAAVGLTGIAFAASPQTHVMTVRLPGGGVEQIRYTGDIAPQVVVEPAFPAAWQPVFAPDPAFAALQRISAEMDREAADLWQQAQAMLSQPPSGLAAAAFADMPAGSRSYRLVTTMTGNGVCMRSTEITAQGDGRPPQVVTRTAGDCSGPAGANAGSIGLPTAPPAPANRPEIVLTRATGTHPAAGLVREATWQR